MDIVDGLLPLGFAICCIVIINFLVIVKFSFARLREEHVEDMEHLDTIQREFLFGLYQKPEYFLNTTQFLILFFILLLAGTGTYIFNVAITHIMDFIGIDDVWIHHVIDFGLLLAISTVVLIFGEIVPKALGLSFPERYIYTFSRIVTVVGRLVYPFV